MLGVRVALRPCLPAFHDRHLQRPFTLYAELVRFPIYGRYRCQAFDLQVPSLEMLRTQTKLQTKHGGFQTLAIHLGDVGPSQVLRVDLYPAENTKIERKKEGNVYKSALCFITCRWCACVFRGSKSNLQFHFGRAREERPVSLSYGCVDPVIELACTPGTAVSFVRWSTRERTRMIY